MIKVKNINNAIIEVCKKLHHSGTEVAPRGFKTKELQNCFIEMDGNESPIITLPERKLSRSYLEAELVWYKSGDPKIDYIKKYSTFWEGLTDENETINSNYGKLAIIDKYSGMSQLDWCIDQLREDSFTRQAIINYNQPQHKYKNNKDFVCTIAQQFILNSDNKLDCLVMMRSNDLIYGFSYDVPWFNYLHKLVAEKTHLEVGKYRHFATSMHVYKRHFDMVEKIALKY